MNAGDVLPAKRAVPIGLGLLVGAAVAWEPMLGLLGAVAAVVALIGILVPSSLVVMLFLGMLFDRLGLTGANVADLPVTASKLSVLGGLGLWGVRAALGGGRMFRWHPVIGAMLGIVAMTAILVARADCLFVGKYDLFGLAMVTVLVAFVYAVLVEARLEGLYRSLGAILCAVFLLSLAPGTSARASGTFGDPNEWGTIVLLLTPTLLGGLADERGALARPLRVLLLLLAPLMVLRTGSRSALAVGALILPGCVYLLRQRRRELLVSGACVALAAPLAIDLGGTIERLRLMTGNLEGTAVVQDASLEERGELFRQGLDLLAEHWLLGTGPGTFPTATGFVSTLGEFRPAHNTYLELACEQGVVGMIPVAILAGTVFMTLRGGLRAARDTGTRSRILGVAIGLAAVALMAATLGLLTFSMAYLVLGMALAITTKARGSVDATP